jgi:uncharacterized protein with beta-barrel porin domain
MLRIAGGPSITNPAVAGSRVSISGTRSRIIVRQMSSATTHGRLRYDIHAMSATHRCASARGNSRDPMVDSGLTAGHAGTVAAVRGSARESALWRDRRCCALSCGKRERKLVARADAELGEDLSQVVGDGGAADEQLRGDLRV